MVNRDQIVSVLLHRVRTHRAALANAAALGWPPELAADVGDTAARLEECLTVGAELLGVDAADVLAGDPDADEFVPAMGHGRWWHDEPPAYGFQCDDADMT